MLLQNENVEIQYKNNNEWVDVDGLESCDVNILPSASRSNWNRGEGSNDETYFVNEVINSIELNFERGSNTPLDNLIPNKEGSNRIELRFKDGARYLSAEFMATKKVNTKISDEKTMTYLSFMVPAENKVKIEPVADAPEEYLKTIAKNTGTQEITITDQNGNETKFNYGGGGDSTTTFTGSATYDSSSESWNWDLGGQLDAAGIVSYYNTNNEYPNIIVTLNYGGVNEEKYEVKLDGSRFFYTTTDKYNYSFTGSFKQNRGTGDIRYLEVIYDGNLLETFITVRDLVKANPTETATDSLTKMTINGTTYSVGGSSGGDVYIVEVTSLRNVSDTDTTQVPNITMEQCDDIVAHALQGKQCLIDLNLPRSGGAGFYDTQHNLFPVTAAINNFTDVYEEPYKLEKTIRIPYIDTNSYQPVDFDVIYTHTHDYQSSKKKQDTYTILCVPDVSGIIDVYVNSPETTSSSFSISGASDVWAQLKSYRNKTGQYPLINLKGMPTTSDPSGILHCNDYSISDNTATFVGVKNAPDATYSNDTIVLSFDEGKNEVYHYGTILNHSKYTHYVNFTKTVDGQLVSTCTISLTNKKSTAYTDINEFISDIKDAADLGMAQHLSWDSYAGLNQIGFTKYLPSAPIIWEQLGGQTELSFYNIKLDENGVVTEETFLTLDDTQSTHTETIHDKVVQL